MKLQPIFVPKTSDVLARELRRRISGDKRMAIDCSLDKHVATITINRPERMNAMDAGHYDASSAARVRVGDDVAEGARAFAEKRPPAFTGI